MFRLSTDEHTTLMSQIATSNEGRGGNRKLPWAFTEHGAIQAANVLNSATAVAMGVHVVRASAMSYRHMFSPAFAWLEGSSSLEAMPVRVDPPFRGY